jgi:hypothetical protein
MKNIRLIPRKESHLQTVLLHTKRRTLTIYLYLVALGGAIAQYSNDSIWRIFGLGFMFPAGGFLMHGIESFTTHAMHGILFLGGLLLFGLSLVLWFATGNVIAPIAMWLFLAVFAAFMGEHHYLDSDTPLLIVCLSLGSILAVYIISIINLAKQSIKRKKLNIWLTKDAPVIASNFGASATKYPELSYDEVKRLRFVLDRALQPIDQFDGFEWLDQFQTAAVRYQINFLGYGLAMMQNRMMPACGAYMHKAQSNLIHKLQDVRIWRYWMLEHLWGNLRYDPDPIKHENIMYTGFAALQIAMFHASSGNNEILQEDNFILRYNQKHIWKHSFSKLIGSLKDKMEESPYAFIACEPNWIYPLCNMIGLSAICYDQPEWWHDNRKRFINSLEHNFMDNQGRIIACRSRRLGLPFPMMGGVMPQALPCLFLSALDPEVALRQWLLVRSTIMQGNILNRKAFWRIDTGNYRFSRAAAYVCVALAAKEMGDDCVYNSCMQALEDECPSIEQGGVIHRNCASVWAHGVEIFARANHYHGFADLIQKRSDKPINHPILHDLSYAEASVASAHSSPNKLNLVLYPHGDVRSTSITLAHLTPHSCYNVDSRGEIQHKYADADGKIVLDLVLDGRTEINMYR